MKKIPVFYRPEQNAPSNASYSPSAGKPALVMLDWLGNEKIAPRLDVKSFEPVSRKLLYQVHEHDYVDGVLNGYIANGFGNRNPDVAASLPYTVGSMVAAARYVLENRHEPSVAVSPTSGFHHAEYNQGGGYCTFNGLMATAVEMYRLGLAERILILDFDQHYGNGTESIIHHLGIDYVTHITSGKSYRTAEQALGKSDIVGSHIVCNTCHRYDLILYQAGADIHVDDPLGGILTTQQMLSRDIGIFWGAKSLRVPLVWCLAGGYSKDDAGSIEPVLALHRQTMLECIREYAHG